MENVGRLKKQSVPAHSVVQSTITVESILQIAMPAVNHFMEGAMPLLPCQFLPMVNVDQTRKPFVQTLIVALSTIIVERVWRIARQVVNHSMVNALEIT